MPRDVEVEVDIEEALEICRKAPRGPYTRKETAVCIREGGGEEARGRAMWIGAGTEPMAEYIETFPPEVVEQLLLEIQRLRYT